MSIVQASTHLDDLRDEYAGLFATMEVTSADAARDLAEFAVAHKALYVRASDPVSVPWFFTALVHRMECDGSFACHLHNGDPLTKRTTHVPSGRPRTGRPPFDWTFSAQDALTIEGYNDLGDWSLLTILYRLESFNGWGYRLSVKPPIATPYLWSGSNHYTSGKFVSDGYYDKNAVSEQIGASVILRSLMDLGEVTQDGGTPG